MFVKNFEACNFFEELSLGMWAAGSELSILLVTFWNMFHVCMLLFLIFDFLLYFGLKSNWCKWSLFIGCAMIIIIKNFQF